MNSSEFLANYEELVASKDNFFFNTFDDGLKEQFDFALPILDELGMQAIFFANSMNTEENRVSTVHKIHLLRSVISSHVLLDYLKEQKIAILTQEELQKATTNYRFDDAASAELKYLLNFKISFDVQESLVQSIFEKHFSESEILESLYMSKSQLQYLANIDCLGSHTHTHYPLGFNPKANMKNNNESLVPLRNRYFEEIKQICKANHINLIAVTTPMCSNVKGMDYFKKVKALYPEIKEYEDVVEGDEYFSSCGHLNDKGARLYTKMLLKENIFKG